MNISLVDDEDDYGTLLIKLDRDDSASLGGHGNDMALRLPLYAHEARELIRVLTPLAASDRMVNTKWVAHVVVKDPDTGLYADVEIRKLDDGPMVGLDSSYLEQLDGDPYKDFPLSPYDPGVGLLVPDDEKAEAHGH
jgi:hypothetical protein